MEKPRRKGEHRTKLKGEQRRVGMTRNRIPSVGEKPSDDIRELITLRKNNNAG